MIQSIELDSGARIILESVDNTDVASIGLWQLSGSRDEGDSEAGYTHFLEHMLFKGTARRNAYQIAQEVERVGGYLNAFTEKEVTCFYCTLPGEHLDLAMDVLTDMYFSSLLEEQELHKEKAVIVNEIKTIEDNPEEKGQQIYLEGLWNRHPLSRKITGEVHHVEAIDKQRLLDFYKRHYLPVTTVITASGKIDPDRLRTLLSDYFATNGGRQVPAARKFPASQVRWQAVPDKFEQVHLYTGTSYPSSTEIGEYYQDLVFNTLFGESMSSRLFQRLREDRGLCYSVSSFRTYFTDVSLWTIYANTVPSLLPNLVEAINEELARLHEDPPSEQEIADAKSQLKGNMILAREDMENRMKRLFRQYHLTHGVVEYGTSLELLEAVGRREILSIIEKRIQPDHFNLLAYGSRKLKRLPRNAYSF
ncbi:MAG: insulinase family protein [Spirochaetaceae bacterium]|nr:MAG: insulinase family protein [Spirochaetaceae bacterium]